MKILLGTFLNEYNTLNLSMIQSDLEYKVWKNHFFLALNNDVSLFAQKTFFVSIET